MNRPVLQSFSSRGGLWTAFVGLLLACGPPALAENFQAQGQNTYCVTCSVGIGLSSPVSKLHVFTSNQSQVTVESSSGSATDTALDLRANSRRWVLGINVGALGPGKLFLYDVTASASRFMIDTTGNIGIGTTAPVAKLDVRGDLQIGRDEANIRSILKGFSTQHAAGNVPSELTLGVSDGWTSGMTVKNFRDGSFNSHSIEFVTSWGGINAGTRLLIDKVGNVGIGTSVPAVRLHTWEGNPLGTALNNNRGLERISGSTGNTVMRNLWMVRATAGSFWDTTKLHDAISVDASFLTPGVDTRTWWERHPAANTQSWGTGNSTFMTLTGTGDLGIGTAAPTAKLHVQGDLFVSGNIAAKYQDVAEWVPSTRRILPGTVVILDESQANNVLPSRSSYDTKVAGVVSARPGLVLGESGEGKVLVATTGRVRVRADARRGSIRIGDLLVTSDHEGVAMRSEPVTLSGIALHRPGTLIGKALENLDAGEGEILVLLSLQ